MLSAWSSSSPSAALRVRAGRSRAIVSHTVEPDGTRTFPSGARRSPETRAVTRCPSELRSEWMESSSMARISVPIGRAWAAAPAESDGGKEAGVTALDGGSGEVVAAGGDGSVREPSADSVSVWDLRELSVGSGSACATAAGAASAGAVLPDPVSVGVASVGVASVGVVPATVVLCACAVSVPRPTRRSAAARTPPLSPRLPWAGAGLAACGAVVPRAPLTGCFEALPARPPAWDRCSRAREVASGNGAAGVVSSGAISSSRVRLSLTATSRPRSPPPQAPSAATPISKHP